MKEQERKKSNIKGSQPGKTSKETWGEISQVVILQLHSCINTGEVKGTRIKTTKDWKD